MRAHQLLEAHVRCYCVRDEADAAGRVASPRRPRLSFFFVCARGSSTSRYFQQCAMRLDKPDDELGGYLFLALPSTVVHRLDEWSPLMPPRWWLDAYYDRGPALGAAADDAMTDYAFPRPLQRASDADAGGRSAARCAVCGETYETARDLATHHADAHPALPAPRPRRPCVDAEAVRAFLKEGKHEVVVLIEGVDATTSSTIQATHSYKAAAGDVVWHCDFAPCVSRAEDGSCAIDFGKFHDLVSTGENYRAPPPPPPSHS